MKDKLFEAIKSTKSSLVEKLLQEHIDINSCDKTGKTALFYSLLSGDTAIVRSLIAKGSDVHQCSYVAYHRENQLYSCMEPPIVTAARVGNFEALKLLVEAGANIDAQSEIRKRDDVVYKDLSALHIACEDSRLDMVGYLLSHNADVHLEDKAEELPLHKTVRCGKNCEKQSQIVQSLCEHGSDVNHIDKLQASPLYLATFYGCIKKMEILLLYGADVNRFCRRENSYGTPLHIVVARDRVDMMQLLIQHGAQLNTCNALECTPLHLNINTMIKSSIAQHLLYHGALVDGRDKWEYSILGACIRNMRIDCEILSQLFVCSGLDLNKEHWLKPLELRDAEEPEAIQEIPIASGRVEKLCEWLREQQSNPRSLSDLTRIYVRRRLSSLSDGRSIVSRTQALPLPNALKDFLLLKEYIDLNITPSTGKIFGKPF